jgi:hypothetical protein
MPRSRLRPPSTTAASAYPELRRFLRHKGAVTGSVLLLVLMSARGCGISWIPGSACDTRASAGGDTREPAAAARCAPWHGNPRLQRGHDTSWKQEFRGLIRVAWPVPDFSTGGQRRTVRE